MDISVYNIEDRNKDARIYFRVYSYRTTAKYP